MGAGHLNGDSRSWQTTARETAARRTQTALSSIAPPWSRGIFFIDRYRSRKMRVLKDRQNVRIMLSMYPAPYCNARRPSATSRQRQPPSRAIGNPMGCQAMMNPLTWEHRSLTIELNLNLLLLPMRHRPPRQYMTDASTVKGVTVLSDALREKEVGMSRCKPIECNSSLYRC